MCNFEKYKWKYRERQEYYGERHCIQTPTKWNTPFNDFGAKIGTKSWSITRLTLYIWYWPLRPWLFFVILSDYIDLVWLIFSTECFITFHADVIPCVSHSRELSLICAFVVIMSTHCDIIHLFFSRLTMYMYWIHTSCRYIGIGIGIGIGSVV